MKRILAVLGVTAVMGTFSVIGASSASADCGWPSCNPAYISGKVAPWILPPGGNWGQQYVAFSSNIYYPTLETWASFSGNSNTQWWGCCPWNANSVTLSDSFMVSGIAVSVSLPPSVGFSGSGSNASYSTTNSNNWINSHQYSGVDFNAFDLYSVGQNTCSSMQFSWKGFYTCTGSHWVLI